MEIKTFASPKGDIQYIRLTNAVGASVVISTLGAGIVEVNVPDRDGRLADVILGYEDPLSYIGDGPCAGKVPGRYANRIARGHLVVDGHTYTLACNCGPNHLHGGPEGFQNQIWTLEGADEESVAMSYVSPDGEEGYPGTVKAMAVYRWTDDCRLELTLSATTDSDTVINLTNHAYWNLGGHDSGCALDHMLELGAARYLPTDSTLVPEGVEVPVDGSPMDFRRPKRVGEDIKANFPALIYGKGYDNCWVITADAAADGLRKAAELTHESSGRVMTLLTDQPAVQVYTGNWLDDSPVGKGGCRYRDYDAVAIECQDYPDAPNQPAFPSTLLRPGEVYRRRIVFAFTVKE